MLIALTGNKGSGKSLTAVKEIATYHGKVFTNFNLKKNIPYHRLKVTDIIKYEQDKKGNYKPTGVNWDFWKKVRKENKHYSIFLDEVHDLVNSRSSMSRGNILLSKWVAQIRKILSDSDYNNLWIISQDLKKIDVNFRDLIDIVILPQIVKDDHGCLVINTYYDGIDAYYMGMHFKKMAFYGDQFFKYYNHKELINIDDEEKGYI